MLHLEQGLEDYSLSLPQSYLDYYWGRSLDEYLNYALKGKFFYSKVFHEYKKKVALTFLDSRINNNSSIDQSGAQSISNVK